MAMSLSLGVTITKQQSSSKVLRILQPGQLEPLHSQLPNLTFTGQKSSTKLPSVDTAEACTAWSASSRRQNSCAAMSLSTRALRNDLALQERCRMHWQACSLACSSTASAVCVGVAPHAAGQQGWDTASDSVDQAKGLRQKGNVCVWGLDE